MPTRKPRKHDTPARRVVVKLTKTERTELGIKVLGVADGARRSEVLSDLEGWLGHWATALANASNVLLRSDLVSMTMPLVQRARTFQRVLDQCDDRLRFLFEAQGFGHFDVLFRQLHGFEDFLVWLKQEPSKKGGERSAYRRWCHDQWRLSLAEWFDKHANPSSDSSKTDRRRRLLRIAQSAVERAAKVRSPRSNTGKK